MTECRHGEVQLIPGIGARCGVCGTRATFQPAAPADATSTANDARVSHPAPAEGLDEDALADAMRYGYAWSGVPLPGQWLSVARAVAGEYQRRTRRPEGADR